MLQRWNNLAGEEGSVQPRCCPATTLLGLMHLGGICVASCTLNGSLDADLYLKTTFHFGVCMRIYLVLLRYVRIFLWPKKVCVTLC